MREIINKCLFRRQFGNIKQETERVAEKEGVKREVKIQSDAAEQ